MFPRRLPRHSCFRLFLVLALLCNGLATAHAAAAHALMALPVQAVAMVEQGASAAGMQDCHDMAGHHDDGNPAASASDADHSTHDKAASCCQGPVCNCACAVSLPASLPALASAAFWPSQPVLFAPDRYRSIAAALILRPPIA